MFKKILIANRGEIAVRVIRACKEWGIATVAVHSDVDRDSMHVRLADESVCIGSHQPANSYLNIPALMSAIELTKAEAVHPGYGFLSENATFAKVLEENNIKFIGASSKLIEMMGDKIQAKIIAKEHGLPVIEGSEGGITDIKAAKELCKKIGFPVLIKASAGGGGKGMSIVNSRDELEDTLRVAASEAEKYFGDKRVYVERYFASARHIEVQVLGDGQRVMHFGERECSIQRRFQKVIEEAPSPVLDEQKRRDICEVAVGIAQAANYSSAGTVEFLYTPEGEFFFLEMNTRIQVEHPVTEMVYGVDLVAEQIKIAAGKPLGLKQSSVEMSGHAIECRLCAEDAFDSFMPETGKVLYLKEPSGEGVRFDSGLYQGQEITTAFDPMLAKLVVHAPTRAAAIAAAIKGLRELVLLGVKTNSEYMIKVLEHPAFLAGEIDTAFVETFSDDLILGVPPKEKQQAVLSAAYLSDRNTTLLMDATPEPYAAIGHWRN